MSEEDLWRARRALIIAACTPPKTPTPPKTCPPLSEHEPLRFEMRRE